MDRSPWESAIGGVAGAAASMGVTWSVLLLQAGRLDPPTDEIDAVARVFGGLIILGYSLFAAGVAGTVVGSTIALVVARRDRIVSTVATLVAMELVAVPVGVAVTLYSQDHAVGDLLFALSVGLITAVVPFAARVVARRI